MSEYEFWIYKDQTGFACTLSSLSSNNMLNIAKSTTPTVPSAVESKDWTKVTTPELQSGSEDEVSTQAGQERGEATPRRGGAMST